MTRTVQVKALFGLIMGAIVLYTVVHSYVTMKKADFQSRVIHSCIIDDMPSLLNTFTESNNIWDRRRPECAAAKEKMARLFEVEVSTRQFDKTDMKTKIMAGRWFHQSDMREMFFQQSVVTLFNRWTRTTTVRNPLRSQRPSTGTFDAKFILNLTTARSGCDFCSNHFLRDPTGNKLDGRSTRVAANAFKMQDFHALFIPVKHNPLSLYAEDFTDIYETAQRWFDWVRKTSSVGHTHPTLIWDSLPHAGASQLHVHMHGFMGRGNYLGQFRNLQLAIDQFSLSRPNDNYIDAYIDVHVAAGLALAIGKHVVLTPIDARKSHEFIVIGPSVDEEFSRIVHAVHRTYIDELNVFCWSSAMSFPTSTLETPSRLENVAFFRIGSRGSDCASPTSDVSSLELYMFDSVDTDPYNTMSAFKRRHAATIE